MSINFILYFTNPTMACYNDEGETNRKYNIERKWEILLEMGLGI